MSHIYSFFLVFCDKTKCVSKCVVSDMTLIGFRNWILSVDLSVYICVAFHRKMRFQVHVLQHFLYLISFFQGVLSRDRHIIQYSVDTENQWCEFVLQVNSDKICGLL